MRPTRSRSVRSKRIRASPMISKLRSTADRGRRSLPSSASERPRVSLLMNAPAAAMSSSDFHDLGGIVDHPAGLGGLLPEPRVAQGRGHHQANIAHQERGERTLQILEAAEPRPEIVAGRVLHQEIDVAGYHAAVG